MENIRELYHISREKSEPELGLKLGPLPMSMEPWVATKITLHYCGGDTSSCQGP